MNNELEMFLRIQAKTRENTKKKNLLKKRQSNKIKKQSKKLAKILKYDMKSIVDHMNNSMQESGGVSHTIRPLEYGEGEEYKVIYGDSIMDYISVFIFGKEMEIKKYRFIDGELDTIFQSDNYNKIKHRLIKLLAKHS